MLLMAAGCASAPPAVARPAPSVERARWVMGTRLRIVAFHESEAKAAAAIERAFGEAERLDALLSHYKADSELSAINRDAGTWREASPEMLTFARACLDAAARTDGLFDPTVGPLVRAGGATDARALVGWRLLEFDGTRVRLARAGMALDPGGIGKGYAVDAMVAALRAAGVSRALVDFGESSFYAYGEPGFRIAVRDASGQPLGPHVELRDASLSTSMTRTFPDRRTHIFDPRTGLAVETARTAAVVMKSATMADVLSTALCVGGAERMDLVERFPGTWAWFHEQGSPPVERRAR